VDNVDGLIEGVRLGLGKAIVPKHLIKKEKDFIILNSKIVMKVPMYLVFYKQSYYSKLHHEVVQSLILYFHQNFLK